MWVEDLKTQLSQGYTGPVPARSAGQTRHHLPLATKYHVQAPQG